MATGLEKALKTVDIKGKAYVTVNERIKYFREHFTGYSLISEIVYNNEAKYLTWQENGETNARTCLETRRFRQAGPRSGREYQFRG